MRDRGWIGGGPHWRVREWVRAGGPWRHAAAAPCDCAFPGGWVARHAWPAGWDGPGACGCGCDVHAGGPPWIRHALRRHWVAAGGPGWHARWHGPHGRGAACPDCGRPLPDDAPEHGHRHHGPAGAEPRPGRGGSPGTDPESGRGADGGPEGGPRGHGPGGRGPRGEGQRDWRGPEVGPRGSWRGPRRGPRPGVRPEDALRLLEEHQRALEQELADVVDEISRLRRRIAEDGAAGQRDAPKPEGPPAPDAPDAPDAGSGEA